MRLSFSAGLAATAMVFGLAGVPGVAAAGTAEKPRGCPDVTLVWAGGQGTEVVRSGFARRLSVRTVVAAQPAPVLVPEDWSAVQEQGLDHPHFDGVARAARAAMSAMRASTKRCPSTALVLGGHSEGAVAARLLLRRLGAARHRDVRSHLTRVALLGDPAVEPGQRVPVEPSNWLAEGLLAGPSTRLPGWAVTQGLVREVCLVYDPFCDSRGQGPDSHYDYSSADSSSEWLPRLVSGAVLPSRVSEVMLTRGDALDGSALGLPALRMVAMRPLPEGLRIQRHSTGDRLVGRPRPGRSTVVVRARGVGRSSALARRLTVEIKVRPPGGRRGTVLVTRGVDGRPANGQSFGSLVSASGSTVVFASTASNLVRRALGGFTGLFAWDRATRRSELVGILPDGSVVSGSVRDMSSDGRRVLFEDWSGEDRMWLRDRDSRTTVAVPSGSQLDARGRVVTYPAPETGWHYTSAASADARYVVMASAPPDVVVSAVVQVRVWDNQSGTVVRSGQLYSGSDGGESAIKLSADGRYLAVVYGGAHGDHSSKVVDLADGSTVAPGIGEDVSDDGRWILNAGFRNGITVELDRIGKDKSIELMPGSPRVAYPDFSEDAVSAASTSEDGSAVAYSFDGDLVVGGVRPVERQIYYWKAR